LLFDHPDNLRFSETAFPHVVCSFRLGRLYITARELPGGRSIFIRGPRGGCGTSLMGRTPRYRWWCEPWWTCSPVEPWDHSISKLINTVQMVQHISISVSRTNIVASGVDRAKRASGLKATIIERPQDANLKLQCAGGRVLGAQRLKLRRTSLGVKIAEATQTCSPERRRSSASLH
jgi:hypothetical protein